jgi:threonyl-tRNA synthetase
MRVKLPDGNLLDLPDAASGLDAATTIGQRLGQATAGILVNGELRDLRAPLADGDEIAIVRVGDEAALPILRHSTAHLLAEAVQHLYPGVKVTIGPAIDAGFYYDFDFPEPISDEDLPRIEAEMRRILSSGRHAYTRTEVSRDEARTRFAELGETYKVELIDGLPEDQPITFYEQDGFVDLCRGPHLQDTKPIRAFRLTSLAGAYWRGDASRPQLTRIYGTAFFDQADLDAHLERIEEAKRRDHRRLGPQLGLFTMHREAQGAPFWHPDGLLVWNALLDYWRGENRTRGYREVKTPLIFSDELWKTSGHWENYQEHMFLTRDDERSLAVKPMNCPGHCILYKSERRSYRDLPLRLNEAGLVHRNEPSGTLHGLMRVRHITQDDAHIFCAEDQIEGEVAKALEFAISLYDLFEMPYRLELSTRPEKRIGSDELWDRAEGALTAVLDASGLEYAINEGDGAFYGPKIDAHVTDAIGRSWQTGTFQLDFNMPERFDLTYIGADDAEHRPVMIHRAMLGSFERFLGILIEHFAGAWPLWLAPVQAQILPIADRHADYAREVASRLEAAGLRTRVDERSESVGRKIRDAEADRRPVMLVVGDAEAEAGTVAVRRLGRRNLGVLSIDEAIASLSDESARRLASV